MLMIVGGMLSKSYATASLDDTITPYVAFNSLYDSNFFRKSNQPVSEFMEQVEAGFDMDWAISRQHIIIKANANQNWFQNTSSLNYTGWDTLAQLNWQIGNDLNGEIGYANIQELGSYYQLNSEQTNNLQNNQRAFANAGYLFHPNGKIKLGVFRTEIDFVDRNRQFNNNTEDNAELNLQYLSPAGNTLGFRFLATDGQYPQREFTAISTQDSAYTRMLYAVTGDYGLASRKTRIDGLIGYTYQNYDHFSDFDFADIIGALNLNWQASDKTLLLISARRQINQTNSQQSSFVLTQGVWFDLTWQSTPKIALKLPMSYQHQDYLGGVNASANGLQQKDNIGAIGVNLIYSPLDNISIGAVFNYEKRDSNLELRGYETESAEINLQAAF